MPKAYGFEDTRDQLVEALSLVWDVSLQSEEFLEVGQRALELQRRVMAMRPREEQQTFIEAFNNRGRALIRRARLDPLPLIAAFIGIMGAYASLKFGAEGLRELLKRFWTSELFISPAFAASTVGQAIDPTALLIFQIVIAFMIPLMVIGAFGTVMFAKTPDGRKSGRDILIGVMGFVLGAATRFL